MYLFLWGCRQGSSKKNLPRDCGLLFVFLSISELNHQNTFLHCSRKSWNFLSSLCSPARKHLGIFLVIQPLQPSWAQPGALGPGVGCDVHRAQGGTETLWWRELLSPNQNITQHHWEISNTAWTRSPCTRQPGLSAPAHQEPHSTVTGSMRITTADGQPSESVNNKMSLKKIKERKRTAEQASQGGKQNCQYSPWHHGPHAVSAVAGSCTYPTYGKNLLLFRCCSLLYKYEAAC